MVIDFANLKLQYLKYKDEINESLQEVLDSSNFIMGKQVNELEKNLENFTGAKYAVAVTSNSHGQDLVMKALDIKDGDVINPTISFMATAMIPLWQENITTNVVDVDPINMNIDPEAVRKAITPNTKAIIAVNQAGIPAPIDKIREFYDGFIIEDCAHSCWTPGAGLGGDCAVWSFQAVKTMPMGDGGMITTDDKELADKCRELTWFGVSSTWSRASGQTPGYAWDYQVDLLGYKYYMIDIMAAICLEQMKKLPAHLERRRHIQSQYNERLFSEIKRPPHSETVQYYIARVPKYKNYAPDKSGAISVSRDGLIDYLSSKNVHTSVHFKPLHKYGILRQTNYRDYPVADNIWESLISLPCHPAMTDEDIDYVIYWVNKYFED